LFEQESGSFLIRQYCDSLSMLRSACLHRIGAKTTTAFTVFIFCMVLCSLGHEFNTQALVAQFMMDAA
jgi:hypothetical protein